MRSRAALLPYPGDPFLLNYWLHLYEAHWKDEIDHLYIGLNSEIEPAIVDYIRALCNRPNITLDYVPHMNDHGNTVDRLLELTKETHVMLVEDDGFIFHSGVVNTCFLYLEEMGRDIVGSKRGSCHDEISDRAALVWGIPKDGEGDQGCNFWPNFFFTTTELLKRTDRKFGAKAWYKGEEIPQLALDGVPYVVQNEVIYGDTFVNTSLQLRGLVPESRIQYVPQFHGHPDDLKHYESRYPYSMFGGAAGWCHIGSLSSGVGGVLRDAQNRPLSRRLIDPPGGPTVLNREWCDGEFAQREWERRVQWWLRFYEFATPTAAIEDFYLAYGEAVHQIISQYKLSIKAIRQRQEIYATLGL